MCQSIVGRLWNHPGSCQVRKVASLLARPLSYKVYYLMCPMMADKVCIPALAKVSRGGPLPTASAVRTRGAGKLCLSLVGEFLRFFEVVRRDVKRARFLAAPYPLLLARLFVLSIEQRICYLKVDR